MAAELRQGGDGKAEMFSVLATPWHRDGHVLTEAPTFKEGTRLAGHDYEVVKRPNKIVLPDGTERDSTMSFSTVRTDTMAELGSVGRDYQPVQNWECFEVLEPLVDAGIGKLETGGVLRDGADAWLLLRWNLDQFGPVVREVFGGELIPFALVAANHSGRRGVLLKDTQIRVVCANTLGAAEHGDGIVIPHRKNARERVRESAEKLWGGVIERCEIVATRYRAMKATTMSEQEFDRLVVQAVSPDPRLNRQWNPEARMATTVVERFLKRRAALHEAWASGKGHVGDRSVWEAYNGAVEVIDHNADLFPTRSGVYRTGALMFGSLREKKAKVLTNLSKLVGVRV